MIRPDAILNIIDGTNLERNLYLSTQIDGTWNSGCHGCQYDGYCKEEW